MKWILVIQYARMMRVTAQVTLTRKASIRDVLTPRMSTKYAKK